MPAGISDLSLLQNFQKVSGAHPASYSVNSGGSFARSKAAGVKLTIRLHLVPRLRMSGAMPPHPLHAIMPCIMTTLSLPLPLLDGMARLRI